jgi:hypothetical protein
MKLSTKILAIALGAAIAVAFVVTAVAATPVDAAGYVFTRDLTVGSTGADVMELQKVLNASASTQVSASGVGAPGMESSYFGSLTKAALAKWQAAHNVAPAVGYFGPLTRAAVNAAAPVITNLPAGCTTPSGYSPTTGQACNTASNNGGNNGGALQGGAGDITVTSLSTYSNENVVEGAEDVNVLAVDVEADEESDVELTSIKVSLEQTTAADSEDITDYIDSVAVWLDGEKVGEADADEFSEASDVYSKSISLDNAIIRAGDELRLVISVTASNNLDSGDIDTDSFTVDIVSTRFEDAEGVVSTDTTNVTSRTFDFDSLATSGDLEAKITKNTSSPEASSVEVSNTANTNDVPLLAVNFKASGSDMTVDQLSFNIAPVGANANEIVQQYKLLVDGEEIDAIAATSITTGSTTEIVFTDLGDDFEVAEDDTVKVELLADINDFDGNFGNGDSITASLTSTNFAQASSTIDDANGDTVLDADRSGSVTGKAQSFYVNGIAVALVGTPTATVSDTSTTETNDVGTYKISFSVTAFGSDIYVDSQSASSSTDGVQWSITGDSYTASSSSNLACTGCTAGTGNYLVTEGDTETFTLTVTLVNTTLGTDGYYGIQIDEIGIGTADDATAELTVTAGLEDFETTRVNLQT